MTHALVQLLVGDSRATASQVRCLAPEHWGGLLLVWFGPFLRLSNIKCKLHEIKLWTWNRIPTFDNETSSRFFWRAGDQLSPGQLEHCGVSKEFSEMPILARIMIACVLCSCYFDDLMFLPASGLVVTSFDTIDTAVALVTLHNLIQKCTKLVGHEISCLLVVP